MNRETSAAIEKIFRSSSSPEELFDAFRFAIAKKVSSIDLYKMLIANPALSQDEIIMFTEKIMREFPDSSYEMSMWTAGVFESNQIDYNYLESSVKYYTKALLEQPTECDPLIKLIKLHSTDLEHPANKHILDIVEAGLPGVHKKSKVYYELADLYKRLGNRKKEANYLALAEKAAERENPYQ
jgi:hypothetical protein